MLDVNQTKANAVAALSNAGKNETDVKDQMVDVFSGKDTRTSYDRAFENLSTEQAKVLRDKYMNNQSSEKIGARMGYSAEKVNEIAEGALVPFARHFEGGTGVVELDEE